jgi:hypothetical protein
VAAVAAGSSVLHLTAAGNTLRAMFADDVLPVLRASRFPRLLATSHPVLCRWPLLVVWTLTQATLLVGTMDAVAPLLSILYLFFTSVLNAALLTLILIGAPSFRPRWVRLLAAQTTRGAAHPPPPRSFRYFNRWTAFFGTIVPFMAMFGIDALTALYVLSAFLVAVIFFAITGGERG